ncbi:MAG: Gfo/Idh/MocA family protein, partial [Blastocatellia bacterium]
VIATPHWQHTELAITALRAGLHVVCEKPLAVSVAQADEVLHAAEQGQGRLTVVFQNRFEPAYQFVKSLLAGGEIGQMIRCEMTETFWRPEAYYKSSRWRGTWRGEGGGALVNQAPHILDRYVWLCGMPENVSGFCDTTLHQIEVEDSVSAIFRHAGGAHGHIHVSTVECPWISRTVIACDRGRITVENGKVSICRLHDSIRARTAVETKHFGDIVGETLEFGGTLLNSVEELLARFYENFALAVAGLQPLFVTAAEARQSVELANAIGLSSATGRTVQLPLNRGGYESFLKEKTGAVGR